MVYDNCDSLLRTIFDMPHFQLHTLGKVSTLTIDQIREAIPVLRDHKCITDISGGIYKISGTGKLFIEKGGFKYFHAEIEKEKMLADNKLAIDYKISKRIYKSYPSTQFIAWAGLAIALTLLVIRIVTGK